MRIVISQTRHQHCLKHIIEDISHTEHLSYSYRLVNLSRIAFMFFFVFFSAWSVLFCAIISSKYYDYMIPRGSTVVTNVRTSKLHIDYLFCSHTRTFQIDF